MGVLNPPAIPSRFNRFGLAADRPAATPALAGVIYRFTDVGSATYSGRVDHCDGTQWTTIMPAIGTYAPVAQIAPGVTLYNPKGLRRWHAALADALFGFAAISVIGDSISVGVGSDGSATVTAANDATYRAQGWVGQLRSLYAATYGDPGEGNIGIGTTDVLPRFTYTGTAAPYSGAGPLEQGARITANASPGTATGALPTCTEVDFWTWTGGGGTCSVTVDGASTGFSLDGGASGANTFSAGNGSSAGLTYTKHTITGLASATHSIVFTGPTSSSGLYLPAVIALKQTTGVRVHRIARAGDTSPNLLGLDSSLVGNANGQARVLATIGLLPTTHLLIISLGVNDFGAQNSTGTGFAQPGTDPTTYKSNLQAAVNQAITNGACVLLLGEPRQNAANYPSPMTYTEQNYWDQAKAIAQATDHCAFLDINDLWGSNVLGQALGFYTTASVHPLRPGAGSIAVVVHAGTRIPYGFNAPTS